MELVIQQKKVAIISKPNNQSNLKKSCFCSTKLAFFSVFLLGLLVKSGQSRSIGSSRPVTARAKLFFKSGYQGSTYIFDGISETCLNFPDTINDKISSVQLPQGDVCLELCEHYNCHGQCVQITSTSTLISGDLGQVQFNDKASSIRSCPHNLNHRDLNQIQSNQI